MYNRTQNENGSWNSRCLECFLTIASAIEGEAELEVLEARHICPEKALSWLSEQQNAAGQPSPRA